MTNLTVTEVSVAAAFGSLGSFSSRFREVVGESSKELPRRHGSRAQLDVDPG